MARSRRKACEQSLTTLAARHRSDEARRAAVALAALLDASRRFPGVPCLAEIADGSSSLEDAARMLSEAGGPTLPGLMQVAAWNASRRVAGTRRLRAQRQGRDGGAPGRAGPENENERHSHSRRLGTRRAGGSGMPRTSTPSAILAGELASLDWSGVSDPAGRVLQEFRAAGDRKRHGAFYTPPAVVTQLVDALPFGVAGGARVLDPACGSGEFLLEAARRGAIVFGADLDAEAVAVARFRLECERRAIGDLVEANLLLPEAEGRGWGSAGEAPGNLARRLEGPFDAVIGNPPYVRFHNLPESEREALSKRFETASGQFDLFAPFLETALARVRPGGTVAFVLPALVLRGSRYAALRRFLLGRARVAAVIDHGDGAFDGVLAPTCVLVLVRHPARADLVKWTTPAGALVEVDDVAWRRDPHCAFAPVSAAASSLLAKLESCDRLRSIAELGRGAEIGKKHPALSRRPGAEFVPCLTGSDVEPWRAHTTRWLDPTALPKRLFPEELRARVLVRETGARLTAVAVPEGTASTRSLFHVVPHDWAELPLDFLLAWLHSSIAQWWFATCVRADSGIFPKLRIGQLAELRIPQSDALIAAVTELAQRRKRARNKADARAFDAWIDEAFATHLRLDPEERALVAATH